MAQKIDKTFVQFVKAKKHRKGDRDNEDDDRQNATNEGKAFSKKKNQSINYLICDKTAQQSEENINESICDFLKRNGQITIINKYKPEKHKIKNIEEEEEEEEEEESESESDESDDYEQGDINHFISNKRPRDTTNTDNDSEEDELETLKEMKATSKKNEGAGGYMGYTEENEDEEEKPSKKKNNKIRLNEIQQSKQNLNNKKPKKEFKANLSNTIFISNLPETLKEADIEKYFNKYGEITTVRLMKTKEGESKGFGYIDYESTKGMKTAINSSLKIKGNQIKIEEAKSSFLQDVSSSSNLYNSFNNPTKRLGKKKQKAMKNKAKTEKRQKKFAAFNTESQ